MIKYGITSVEALHSVEERASRLELDGLRTELVQTLIIASEWIRDNPTYDILGQFDEEKFEEICTKRKHRNYVKDYIKDCLGSPYTEDNKLHYDHVNSTPGLLDLAIEEYSAAAMKSPKLRDKCGKFDHKDYLDKSFRCLHAQVGQKNHQGKKYLIAAPTQSGKSGVKGISISMTGNSGVPMLVVTKGIDESIDLCEKLKDLVDGTSVKREHIVVGECQGW